MVHNLLVTLDQLLNKLIYEKFGGDTIWDMSCGWGGRLLGFLSENQIPNNTSEQNII